jgi:hypothetical protein
MRQINDASSGDRGGGIAVTARLVGVDVVRPAGAEGGDASEAEGEESHWVR